MNNPLRHGGRILADQLKIQGCDTVFCVPGESFLAVLDGLYDMEEIKTIVCRQEGGAAMAAEAMGKLTGKPGVCFVTRGPGATNASAGVHVAMQDSTPMILFIGQVGRDMLDREAFQEIDYRRMFGQLAKWVAQIDSIERIPEYISRAYHTATAGRPGPVVLALPEDVLSATCHVEDSKPAVQVLAKAANEDLDLACDLLNNAERPLIIVGGGGWSQQAAEDLQAFAKRNNLPVCASFRCQDYFSNSHPNYAGHVGIGIDPKLTKRVQEADVILNIGARLGEMTTNGFTLFDIPNPKQKLIHVYPGAEELGRIYRPELAINAASASFISGLTPIALLNRKQWLNWTQQANADYLATLKPLETPGLIKPEQILLHLREILNEDAIICNGAGNYTAWVHRYYQYQPFPTQLAPTSGSMGYGLPAAIAAKIKFPERQVVCFAGDGCFLMTGQELATAVRYELDLLIVIMNNNMYGTIRMHQEKNYPGRVSGTLLSNPNFSALAKSFGAGGYRVQNLAEFMDALDYAKSTTGPVVIEAMIDPEALTPTKTLTQIRDGA